MKKNINVCSEISPLEKVLIHSPDGGVGNIPTNKLHDWLYDDILDVKVSQAEYRVFQMLLLLFLNPSTLFKEQEDTLKFVVEKNGLIKKENYVDAIN